MAWIDPRYEEHQRKRWTRPDSYRFFKPGCPEAKMPGYLHPWAAVARAEEAKAQEAADWETFQREVLELRRDWEELKREIRAQQAAKAREAEALRIKSDLAFERFVRTYKRYIAQQKAGYNPDQPSVPKGNPDGGQWSGDAGKDAGDRARSTDISAQRRGGPRMPATPAQHARLAVANARAREAVSRVQQIDPHWRPQSVTSTDNAADYEVMIRAKQAETREAEARFMALSLARQDTPYPQRDAPTMDEVMMPRGERIGQSSRYDSECQNCHARRVRDDAP